MPLTSPSVPATGAVVCPPSRDTWLPAVHAAAAGIRRRVLAHTLGNDGGYMSQACSAAELLATLYLHLMRLPAVLAPLVPLPFPGTPAADNRAYFTGARFNGLPGPDDDRFFLSPAHYALVVYATLIETGRLLPEGLAAFNRDGSSVEMIGAEHSPGMEVTAGSLGQGISQAAGIAWARRARGDAGRTWVMLSDGELQIGQTWEALQAMAHHRLDRMAVYVDVNGQQCDGTIPSVMTTEPLEARLAAFGCRVVRVDGHDPEALAAPAGWAPDGRPLVVLADTDPCRGLPELRRNAPRLHYLRFRDDAERALYRAALVRLERAAGTAELAAAPAVPDAAELAAAPVVPAAAPPLHSRIHARNLVRFGAAHPRALVLSADLTSSCEADDFRAAHPDRFLSLGIAEQNMLSFAAGLAREGYLPLVHTFAVFICRRAYDQVAMSVAYGNANVKLIGFLPGITTPGGATHQAIEDVALMRLLPNMTVLEVGDATEVESVLDVAAAVDGPVYVRMLRGELPRLFPAAEPMRLDTPRVLSRGDDLTVLSTGICTEEALKAVAALTRRGVGVEHLHLSTLKPCRHPAVVEALSKGRAGVVTLENHITRGGLGGLAAELLAEHGLGRRLVRLGLADTFAHGASRGYLMRKYGLDAVALVGAAETLLGHRFSIPAGELAEVRVDAVHSLSRPEAL